VQIEIIDHSWRLDAGLDRHLSDPFNRPWQSGGKMAKKFYQTEIFDPIHVTDTVYKVRPYLYCTVRGKDGGVHVPGAEVKVVADVWICVGAGNKSGWNAKKLETKYIPRCQVNLEEGSFARKDGTPVEVANGPAVIAAIQERVFAKEQA
jgi:hypothetical protein